EIERLSRRPARLIDGEMTSWYGPRAIAGLQYLSGFARSL
ncbi:MAG: cobalamin-binding protein, partial [Betaproteobacteria bacterium]|nr:cobalamin-binding protein [Betaproteobacteria bacterium]